MSNELRIRDDFTKRYVVKPDDYEWSASPMPGVERMMLDRIGGEIARATSIVRYEPNSEFSPHTHTGGEEFYVLEGVFSDEHGDYPEGTYVRNPIGSSHKPSIGKDGTTIFVKTAQFDEGDTERKVLNTREMGWQPGLVDGLEVMALHNYSGENVALVKWGANTQFQPHKHFGGEEILVLDGVFYDEHGVYPKGSWLRSPHMSEHTPFTKDEGALIYVKVGHLL